MFFLATGCTGHGQESSRNEIDAKVRSTLVTFGETVKGGDALVAKAEGVLVFPDIVKGGIGVGGEYGEGALLMNGRTVDYYNIASGSMMRTEGWPPTGRAQAAPSGSKTNWQTSAVSLPPSRPISRVRL